MTFVTRTVVAVLLVAVVYSVYRTYNIKGPIGSERMVGMQAPAFATPLAGAKLSGDANVYSKEQAKANNATAACDVMLAGAYNSCRELRGRRAVAVFFDPKNKKCTRQVGVLDTLQQSSNLKFQSVAVAIKDHDGNAQRDRAAKRWKLPVAVDRDGAVTALYRVGACPATFFISKGQVKEAVLGALSAQQLRTKIAKLGNG